MSIGPILVRELVAEARRPRTYRGRASIAALMLAILTAHFSWFLYQDGRMPSAWLGGDFARSSVIALAALHFLFAVTIVPVTMAKEIAGERERDTLSSLLTTRLTAAEIIGTKLASGLVSFGVSLAAGLPIMIILVRFGGIDSRLVLLTYAGTASTAFFLAGLAILVSTGVRLKRFAVFSTMVLMVLWLELPIVVIVMLPRLFGRLPRGLMTINDWLLASSPTGILLHLAGAFPRPTFLDAAGWMVGLELCLGTLLIGWAIARLRPVARRLEEKGLRAGTQGAVRSHSRLRRRPACGDDPIFWKERYTSRTSTVVFAVGVLCCVGLVMTLGAIAYYLAVPAAQEVLSEGYGSGGQSVARQEFNRAIIRPMTTVGMFIYLLMLVATIAESMELERARDTWTVLLSTPLSGREILGGKMAAAVLRFRFVAAVMVMLWVAGLVVGSLHPLGFLAALAVLFVATRAGVALGAYAASLSKEKPAAMSWVTSVLILLTMAGPAPCFFLHEPRFVVLGACSPPFVAMLSLATYGEVREAMLGSGVFGDLFQAYGRSSGLDVKWLVSTCVLGLIGPSVCAVWLKRAAFGGFDAAVGRPCRAKPTASPETIDIEQTVM